MIKVSNLSFQYPTGDSTVLKNLSFDLKPGSRTAILGPSGCGKSTLLKILAGILPLHENAIKSTIQFTNHRNGATEVSYVPQDKDLLPWLTAIENVALPEKLGKRITRTPRDLMAKVGLDDAIDLFPNELSGGMKARVSIARSLTVNPDLFLLDEPFSALDELTRFDILELVDGLLSDIEATSILVTHSLLEALYFSDTILVMTHDGKLIPPLVVDIPRPRLNPFENSLSYDQQLRVLHSALKAQEGT